MTKQILSSAFIATAILAIGCGKEAMTEKNTKSPLNGGTYFPIPIPTPAPRLSPLPSPSPTVSPSPTPCPTGLAPVITVLRLAPVQSISGPALVQFNSVGGILTSLTVNGNLVPANTPLLATPSANPAMYAFNISASGPGGVFTKTISFSVPTCTLSASNVTLDYSFSPAQIKADIKIVGSQDAVAYTIAGGQIRTFSSGKEVVGAFNTPYQNGNAQVTGAVFNNLGDTTQCSTNLAVTNAPAITTVAKYISSYDSSEGFLPLANGRDVLNSISGSNGVGISQLSVAILTGPMVNRTGTCLANELQVGMQPATYKNYSTYFRPVCQAVSANVSTSGISKKTITWKSGVSLSCDANEVMVGSSLTNTYSAQTLSISCAKIAWK